MSYQHPTQRGSWERPPKSAKHRIAHPTMARNAAGQYIHAVMSGTEPILGRVTIGACEQGCRAAESTKTPRVRGAFIKVGIGSHPSRGWRVCYLQAALRAAALSVFSQAKVLNFFLP